MDSTEKARIVCRMTSGVPPPPPCENNDKSTEKRGKQRLLFSCSDKDAVYTHPEKTQAVALPQCPLHV